MTSNSLIDRLRAGQPVSALWHQSASEIMVEMSARVGFGTLVIDNEHGPASIGETIRLVRAAQAAGAQTIVRVGSHARDVLSRTLDTGADGILVPMVNTADEARHVVDICRYAPMGNRGVAGSVVKASGYGTVGDYLTRANGATLLAVQVETATAIANLDEILAVPGIDMLFIGPGDLAASMGFIGNTAAPPVVARIEEARQKILLAGRLLGTVPRPDADARSLFAQGCNLVVDGSDIGLFRAALSKKLAELKASLPA